jgi:hypothetical protein
VLSKPLQNRVGTATDIAVLQQLSDGLSAYIQADQASQANQDQIDAEKDAGKKAAEVVKQKGVQRVETSLEDYACSLWIFPDGKPSPCNPYPLDVGIATTMKVFS